MLTTSPELARGALDAAPDAMLIIDAPDIIRFANQQITALFGYSHDEIIGKSIEQLMPERFRAGHVGHRDYYFNNMRVRPKGAGLDLCGRRPMPRECSPIWRVIPTCGLPASPSTQTNC